MHGIIKIAAIAATTAIAITGTAGAANAAASPSVTWSGNGFSLAADGETMYLNNDPNPANDGGTGQFANWDGTGDAFDQGQDEYILWVLTANGATKATITLPDGTTHDMIKVGGTYKFASEYFDYATLKASPPVATYEGAKGKVNLTASHGSAEDTNDVSVTDSWVVDQTTGKASGQVSATDGVTSPAFTAEYTFETDKSWNSTDSDGRGHRYTKSVDLRAVDATAIVGNETGKVYGWNVEMKQIISTIEAVHFTADSEPYLANLRLPIDERQHHRVTIDLIQNGQEEIARAGYIGGSPDANPTAGSKFLQPLP